MKVSILLHESERRVLEALGPDLDRHVEGMVLRYLKDPRGSGMYGVFGHQDWYLVTVSQVAYQAIIERYRNMTPEKAGQKVKDTVVLAIQAFASRVPPWRLLASQDVRGARNGKSKRSGRADRKIAQTRNETPSRSCG